MSISLLIGVNLQRMLSKHSYWQASPRIRFNKEGTLLVVSTSDNGFKVLANADGLRLLRTFENRSFDASRVASETVAKVNKVVVFWMQDR